MIHYLDVLSNGLNAALAIYISVYIVDTVLLYSYSAFGMPVSTTACLVFSLLGASLAIEASVVNWNKAGLVMGGIVCSVVLSGFAAFLIQRAPTTPKHSIEPAPSGNSVAASSWLGLDSISG